MQLYFFITKHPDTLPNKQRNINNKKKCENTPAQRTNPQIKNV